MIISLVTLQYTENLPNCDEKIISIVVILAFALLVATFLFIKIDKKISIYETMAVTDFLTGISNRMQFSIVASQILKESIRKQSLFSIILFDIDHFKKINDTHGHDAGDSVLKGMADLVKNSLRDQDHFARWGGEEFIIILPDTTLYNAKEVAEKLRGFIEQASFEHRNKKIKITCSFGVTAMKSSEEDVYMDVLIKEADDALYKAKHRGRNRVEMHQR
jgi:diguanylate cyclase (GGDEF)-like protein